MKNLSCRMCIIGILVAMVIYVQPISLYAADSLDIIINGEEVTFNDDLGYPFVDTNNRTQVPFRATMEAFGAEVEWSNELKMAYAYYEGNQVWIPMGKDYIFLNNRLVQNDTTSVIVNDRIYCPIRKVLEAFGFNVTFDSNTFVITATSSEYYVNTNQEMGTTLDSGQTALNQMTIVVGFSDVSISTQESDWENFLYDEDNSVSRYYRDMSKGRFQIIGGSETYGIEDNGIVFVNLDSKHPRIKDLDDFDALDFYNQIITAADKYVDYSAFDTNGNQVIEPSELGISVVAAGFEEDYYSKKNDPTVSGVTLFNTEPIEVDGVQLSVFTLTGELTQDSRNRPMMVTIGVYTHEFGHLLGLPDLYDTDYSSVGIDIHGLMGAGTNVFDNTYTYGQYPSPMIAWSRIYAGFIEPEKANQDGIYTLSGAVDTYNIIQIPTSNPSVYYLLENRQLNGYARTFRTFMDHGGIALWRIDEDVIKEHYWDNTVMEDEDNPGIQLIEAGGTDDLKQPTISFWEDRMNHYYALGYDNRVTLEEGITVEVLDPNGPSMRVQITGIK